ncbi:MAG: NADH-ubiquinone oxidoreductase-F iron-sulfur binding region domain-containing protein [Acidimicrobiales bacterium]
MRTARRVLFAKPVTTLADYIERRGGAGLEEARAMTPEAIIDRLEASGLRGRGGAGFPTGRKWRTMIENRSSTAPTTVVVNSAEGEPGTFKDRSILRGNPYHVLEGALIAARAVGADHIVFGMKMAFVTEVARVKAAIAEAEASGWSGDVGLEVFEGPDEYLYGEETALLEAIDGRYPFPRIAPPFRRGVEAMEIRRANRTALINASGRVKMADPNVETGAAPALVDNVETLANIPRIISRGAAWFRTVGTDASPGTIVCTVTGTTVRHGVAEVIMGSPLRAVIEKIGGGARPGRTIKAVMPGVANGLVTEEHLDVPVTYEAMSAIGSGVGSGGFIVFDDTVDLVAVAAGVSRFLGVESCGQCTPCKLGGLALYDLLVRVGQSEATERDFAAITTRVATVADQARCYLAHQHHTVIESVLKNFPVEVRDHLENRAAPVEPYFIAELLDIKNGVAIHDERFADKQPDWGFDEKSTGKSPADHLGRTRYGEWTFKPDAPLIPEGPIWGDR